MSPSAPAYVRYTILLLAAALIVTLGWRGVRWTMHEARPRAAATATTYEPSSPEAAGARAALLQSNFAQALDIALQDAGAGNFSSAEMGVDRAELLITTARLQSGYAPPEFFAPALAQLDRVLAKRPDDARLLEHVTLARISLAEFRSSLSPALGVPPDGTPSVTTGAVKGSPDVMQFITTYSKSIKLAAPREIAANQLVDRAQLGGNYLDATLMPDTAEILLPPSTRAFADHIRVEDVTILGAAQTLDGIHWRNVTFVGTRLRYEGGELSLQNVKFVRCRFGFTTDERGARLANAIASADSGITLTIEAQPPQQQSQPQP
jgi:hypothetical protein